MGYSFCKDNLKFVIKLINGNTIEQFDPSKSLLIA